MTSHDSAFAAWAAARARGSALEHDEPRREDGRSRESPHGLYHQTLPTSRNRGGTRLRPTKR